jgi:hypothetical protein
MVGRSVDGASSPTLAKVDGKDEEWKVGLKVDVCMGTRGNSPVWWEKPVSVCRCRCRLWGINKTHHGLLYSYVYFSSVQAKVTTQRSGKPIQFFKGPKSCHRHCTNVSLVNSSSSILFLSIWITQLLITMLLTFTLYTVHVIAWFKCWDVSCCSEKGHSQPD